MFTLSCLLTVVALYGQAPNKIVFDVVEGVYASDESLIVKVKCYDIEENDITSSVRLSYTTDGSLPDSQSEYMGDDGVVLVADAKYKRITLNVLAENSDGVLHANACYVFDDNGVVYTNVTSMDGLQHGDQVLFVVSGALGPSGLVRSSTILNEKVSSSTTFLYRNVAVDINDEKIIFVPDNALLVTLEKGTNCWYLKTPEGEYISSVKDKSGFELRTTKNTYSKAVFETKSTPYKIKMGNSRYFACVTMDDKIYNWSWQTAIVSSFEDGELGLPMLFKKNSTYQTTPNDTENEFYLVVEDAYTGKQQTIRFTNIGGGKHSLFVDNLCGRFYIRDGRADNSGTYFGVASHNVANESMMIVSNLEDDVFIGRDGGSIELSRNPENLVYLTTSTNASIGQIGRLERGVFLIDLSSTPTLTISEPVVTDVDDTIIDSGDNVPPVYYDLHGRILGNEMPQKSGVYIKQRASDAVKFVIR